VQQLLHSLSGFELLIHSRPIAEHVEANRAAIDLVYAPPCSDGQSPESRVTAHLFDQESGRWAGWSLTQPAEGKQKAQLSISRQPREISSRVALEDNRIVQVKDPNVA
jgi:hypothetical protein